MNKGRPGPFENCQCGCPRIAHHPERNGHCNACGCVEFMRIGAKLPAWIQRREERAAREKKVQDLRKTIQPIRTTEDQEKVDRAARAERVKEARKSFRSI